MSETVDRRWTDTDRELVVSVLWTRACQGNNAGPALDPQPAAEAPMHMWGDAAAVLDALAAAGRLADPMQATSVDCTVTREDVLHDGRCHSCDEPAERHAPARVVARQQELDRLRKAERERDSLARRCALRYEETERLRGQVSYWSAMAGDRAQERDRLAATIRAMPDAIANSAANLAHARQERDDLRARVAKLEQALHETANLAATTPVDEPTTAVDRLGDIVRRAQQAIRDRWRVSATQMATGYEPPSMSLSPAGGEQPTRWELPADIEWNLVRWRCTRCDKRSTWTHGLGDPPASALTDAVADAWRHHADHEQWTAERLSATPPETAGGEQA